ncbi:MATE family efflux transporter [Sandaracinobacter sp. RS1-74]|uniref:MATE family efflux transporter n=1 Tax=Sandaracinobacteroides sayramensis TaxID=2913411 RepID=UPI001EDC1E5B|nr:MATE family efflux transporter [Sandaracinobacteroides sayramensis]MCG2840732.1 MATE family efflux transporter [Sandaracinobacteroides sayramensis]
MDAIASQKTGAPEGSYGELLRLAGPNVLSRLGIMAMGLTDAIVVGHYSAVELGYHSLGWAPTVTVLVAGIGLLQGVQVLTARHMGAGNPEKTGAVLRRGISYALTIGIVSTLALVLLGPLVMRSIGLEPALAAGASAALVVFSLSLTPYLVADAQWFWLEAQGKPQVPMVAMWIANIVNLVLALWIVPGHSPFPVTGAVAAGWVTLVARVSLMLMLGIWIWRWAEAHRVGVFRRSPPDRAESREQRRIGYASGLSYAIEAGAFSGMNFVAAQLGVLVVAAWAVVINVAAVVFMLPMGIAAATAVLVSRSVGAGSIAGVRRAWRMGMTLALAGLGLLSVLIFLDTDLVTRAYTDDAALLAMTGSALLLASLFFMADGAQVVSSNALRARGDIWWPTGMHFISYIVVMLPLGWWLAVHKGGGLDGIVWAVIVASLISGAALTWRFIALGNRMKQGDA